MPKKTTPQAINPPPPRPQRPSRTGKKAASFAAAGQIASHNTEATLEPMRINKYLACSGCCSRRAADELIAAGKVLINGVTACAGQKVEPGDEVSVNGELLSPLHENAGNAQRICIMLHKPVHVVSTASDPQRRRTVLDILPAGLCSERVYPVGRLDYFSEGLILLSNDGELTFRLTHPGWHVPRIYEVKIRGEADTAALQTMRSGMTLAEGEKLAPVDVEVIKTMPGVSLLRLTLHQGVNRQIRRMCRDLGLTILYLKRVQIGPLKLGDLPKGEARHLKKHELAALRKAVGLPA